MSSEAFLDLIRQRFTPFEGKIILGSLYQDALVWKFVQNKEESLPYFETAPNQIQAFAPGPIAVWLIEQEMGGSLPDLTDMSQKLPDPIRQKAAKAFQTVINTGLPPIDLHHAGLLALTLRERRLIKKSWKEISEELIVTQNPAMAIKYFETWRTPFACLPKICADFDQAVNDFFELQKPLTGRVAIPIFLHSKLANPENPDSVGRRFTICKRTVHKGSIGVLAMAGEI